MENLKEQIQPTFDAIVSSIGSFSDEEFNLIPFEGSWTPGQVCEHVKLSIQGMPQLMEGNTKDADRAPDQNVKAFADIFLDFDSKLQSPEFILPEMKTYSKQEFIDFYSAYAKNMSDLVARLDMTKLCLDFEFPTLGLQTRHEFLAFLLFHTQRHTHQLRKIANSLQEKSPA